MQNGGLTLNVWTATKHLSGLLIWIIPVVTVLHIGHYAQEWDKLKYTPGCDVQVINSLVFCLLCRVIHTMLYCRMIPVGSPMCDRVVLVRFVRVQHVLWISVSCQHETDSLLIATAPVKITLINCGLNAACLSFGTTCRVTERSESSTGCVCWRIWRVVNFEGPLSALVCLLSLSRLSLSELRRAVKTTGVKSGRNLLSISFRESCQSASL